MNMVYLLDKRSGVECKLLLS